MNHTAVPRVSVPPLQIPLQLNQDVNRVVEEWIQAVNRTTSSLNVSEPTTQDVPNTPPQPDANRYHTVVSVEYCVDGDVRLIKWFSDIQMAWIWISGQVRERHGENWDIAPFLTTANAMERQWRQGFGDDGFCVADSDGYEYITYYEPTVNYEDVRNREEHF